MPRQNRHVENLLLGKSRKRGCSSSPSSTSTILREGYRFKRAIVVGKRGGSSTPVPTWKLFGRSTSPASAMRTTNSRYAPSPKYAPSQCGSRSGAQPVSARKLAASLWEMNELPSPTIAEDIDEKKLMRRKMRKDRIMPPSRSVHSGSLPPHLSDPSHSPVSERMERSGLGSRHGRASSVSHRLKLADHNSGAMDYISNASFMEIETRSRAETPTRSTTGGSKTRLKDVSNALTTSKELLKIINRMWGQAERPSSSMSLVSALHAELERARLQINRLIQEQRTDETEIDILMKHFAEEKSAWQKKEHEIVEAAIESVAGQLEVEKRLRRRFESLNKKLGKELADTKTALLKAVKEIESEKRARTMIEKVCEELAKDIDEDAAEANELKMESLKVQEEVEKEREMMQLAEALREERVQMKLSEARHQLEEKNAAVDDLRTQVQAFLGAKGTSREKIRGVQSRINEDEISEFLKDSRFGSYHNEDDRDVKDSEEYEEEEEQNSGESDLHSIELNMDKFIKNQKFDYDASRFDEDDDIVRKSNCSRGPRKSASSLQRSVSDGIEWLLQKGPERIDKGKFTDTQKQEGKVYDRKSNKGSKDHVLYGSRLDQVRGYGSPARERPPMIPGTVSKSRLSETRVDGHNARKSRW